MYETFKTLYMSTKHKIPSFLESFNIYLCIVQYLKKKWFDNFIVHDRSIWVMSPNSMHRLYKMRNRNKTVFRALVQFKIQMEALIFTD